MQKFSRRQLHIWLWLVLMIGALGSHSPAYASCDMDKMASQGDASCCVKKQAVCSCDSTEMQHSTAQGAESLAHLCVGVDKPGCPCLAAPPRHENSTAPEPVRMQTEFALLASIPLPSLTPITSREVRAGPVCVTLRDGSAFPSPPRAPPFQG